MSAAKSKSGKLAKTQNSQHQATPEQLRLANERNYNNMAGDTSKIVSQVAELTGQSHDEAFSALYDCDFDANRAVNKLLERSENTDTQDEWQICKKKKPPMSNKGVTSMTPDTSISDMGKQPDKGAHDIDSSDQDHPESIGHSGRRDRPPPRFQQRGRGRGFGNGFNGSGSGSPFGDKQGSTSRERAGFDGPRGSRRGNSGDMSGMGRSRGGGRGGGGPQHNGSRNFEPEIETWTNDPTPNSNHENDTTIGAWSDTNEDWMADEWAGSLDESRVFTPSASVAHAATLTSSQLASSGVVVPNNEVFTSATTSVLAPPPGLVPPTQPIYNKPVNGSPIDQSAVLYGGSVNTVTSGMDVANSQGFNSAGHIQQTKTDIYGDTELRRPNDYLSHFSKEDAAECIKNAVGIGGTNNVGDSQMSNSVAAQANRTKLIKPRLPPPSKIPSSAVEMPGSMNRRQLDVQFGTWDSPPSDTSTADAAGLSFTADIVEPLAYTDDPHYNSTTMAALMNKSLSSGQRPAVDMSAVCSSKSSVVPRPVNVATESPSVIYQPTNALAGSSKGTSQPLAAAPILSTPSTLAGFSHATHPSISASSAYKQPTSSGTAAYQQQQYQYASTYSGYQQAVTNNQLQSDYGMGQSSHDVGYVDGQVYESMRQMNQGNDYRGGANQATDYNGGVQMGGEYGALHNQGGYARNQSGGYSTGQSQSNGDQSHACISNLAQSQQSGYLGQSGAGGGYNVNELMAGNGGGNYAAQQQNIAYNGEQGLGSYGNFQTPNSYSGGSNKPFQTSTVSENKPTASYSVNTVVVDKISSTAAYSSTAPVAVVDNKNSQFQKYDSSHVGTSYQPAGNGSHASASVYQSVGASYQSGSSEMYQNGTFPLGNDGPYKSSANVGTVPQNQNQQIYKQSPRNQSVLDTGAEYQRSGTQSASNSLSYEGQGPLSQSLSYSEGSSSYGPPSVASSSSTSKLTDGLSKLTVKDGAGLSSSYCAGAVSTGATPAGSGMASSGSHTSISSSATVATTSSTGVSTSTSSTAVTITTTSKSTAGATTKSSAPFTSKPVVSINTGVQGPAVVNHNSYIMGQPPGFPVTAFQSYPAAQQPMTYGYEDTLMLQQRVQMQPTAYFDMPFQTSATPTGRDAVVSHATAQAYVGTDHLKLTAMDPLSPVNAQPSQQQNLAGVGGNQQTGYPMQPAPFYYYPASMPFYTQMIPMSGMVPSVTNPTGATTSTTHYQKSAVYGSHAYGAQSQDYAKTYGASPTQSKGSIVTPVVGGTNNDMGVFNKAHVTGYDKTNYHHGGTPPPFSSMALPSASGQTGNMGAQPTMYPSYMPMGPRPHQAQSQLLHHPMQQDSIMTSRGAQPSAAQQKVAANKMFNGTAYWSGN